MNHKVIKCFNCEEEVYEKDTYNIEDDLYCEECMQDAEFEVCDLCECRYYIDTMHYLDIGFHDEKNHIIPYLILEKYDNHSFVICNECFKEEEKTIIKEAMNHKKHRLRLISKGYFLQRGDIDE